MFLFPYHVRLAAGSLRREPAMSVLILLALSIGAGIWSVAVTQYAHYYSLRVTLDPALHQVEILRPNDVLATFVDGVATDAALTPMSLLARTHVSYPEYRRLAGTGIPRRESAGIRSEVIVRLPSGAPGVRIARFTNADFFSMFSRPFAAGAAWDRAAERGAGGAAGAEGVVVLGAEHAASLFPGRGAVGRTLLIDERPFRVVGVLAEQAPINAPWQLLLIGGREDALFLPLGELDRLAARPEAPIYRAPLGLGREELLASGALFVTYWVDLPTPEQRARYREHLERQLGAGRFRLRSLAEWQREFPIPATQISFFGLLGGVVLLGGGFNLARWLLTKGLARSGELGVFRALGAPRGALFWRVIAEAALLSLGAAALAPLFAVPLIALFNSLVRVVDQPLVFDGAAMLLTVLPTILVGVAGAIYPAWRLAQTPPTLYLVRP